MDYGPTYGAEDVVGCGINFTTNSAFFTKNGRYLGKQRNLASAGDVADFSVGEAFSDLRGRLLPMCGVGEGKTKLRVNFGDPPFVYQEIESLYSVCRCICSISSTSLDCRARVRGYPYC
jgi:Ran-binding protein 9/10